MKNSKILHLAFSLLLLGNPSQIKTKPILLENTVLQIADQAGFFDDALPNINKVGKALIDFLKGNSTWSGLILTLPVTTDSRINNLTLYFKNPELISGATYVVISYNHPNIKKYISAKQISIYNKTIKDKDFTDFFSGSYAIHPLTKEKLPVYISNYNTDAYEVRSGQAHLAIPAHAYNDFYFAKKYNLPIDLIVQPTEEQLNNGFKRADLSYRGVLRSPYIVSSQHCHIIKSSLKFDKLPLGLEVTSAVTKALIKNGQARRHSEKIYYSHNNKKESFQNLLKIEMFLKKKKAAFSPTVYKQKIAELQQALSYAHSDFLDLVEIFLVNILNAKQLMIPLVEEFCQKRNKKKCYLLKWSNMSNNESERVRFKKDIINFIGLARFCSDLVQFLSDLSYSCPHAQAYLKSLQNEQ